MLKVLILHHIFNSLFLDIIQYIGTILCKWKRITNDKVSYFKYPEYDLLLHWIMFYFLSDYFYESLHNGQKVWYNLHFCTQIYYCHKLYPFTKISAALTLYSFPRRNMSLCFTISNMWLSWLTQFAWNWTFI